MLRGKKIILGITGSIAAYKSALLVRELVKVGAEVRVIMTDAAKDFITPLTLSTLSKNPVLYRFSDDLDSGEWNNHVELGLWADAMVIAPCSANTMAKMVQGSCDNLLLATYLSARCQTYVAPAMDLDMYSHASTQNNIEGLESNKVKIIYPQEGELASGLAGKGRMTEPEDIRAYLEEEFSLGIDLRGMKILISAGPTYEDIDAVRFIGNRSSGKMGFALAEVCAGLGADVDLISGPVHLSIDHPSVQRIDVRSAKEMHDECIGRFTEADIVIMAAAVADYTPARVSDKKIKKKEGEWAIPLTRTTDILEAIGKAKKAGQVLVGFALETDNEVENARSKMERKNLDLIVLNSLKDSGAGFGHDTNRITIIGKGNFCKEFELKSKREVALDIINTVTEIVQ